MTLGVRYRGEERGFIGDVVSQNCVRQHFASVAVGQQRELKPPADSCRRHPCVEESRAAADRKLTMAGVVDR
jgi:hypothetical protein